MASAPDHSSSRPAETLTFVFTDIEGSTKKWEAFPQAMRVALARHDALLRHVIEQHGGHVFKTVGDAFCAVFPSAAGAVAAALQSQQDLAREEWGQVGPLRIRIGIHAGQAEERGDDYFGPTVNRVARIQSIGHGGQTLLSESAAALCRDALPSGADLKDLGSHRLKDLGRPERVFQLCHGDLMDEFPPLRSLQAFANNLPLQMSSFVGRHHEMADLKELLDRNRLVTLLGAGGTGKTRISLQVAAERLEQYPDGVWFVDLAPITEAELVPNALADALSLHEEGSSLEETLVDHLRSKTLLVILDNCEQVIGACASLAQILLQSCPSVRVLATSREALNIPGERVWRLPALSLPDPVLSSGEKNVEAVLLESDAVRLFVERARAQRDGFVLRRENAASVSEVCRRLDGIPLALELAAARVRVLSVEQIETRLDKMFHLLTGGSRTALPRQQTLRALIDWSYDLLSEDERIVFERLAVFSGGWTFEAFEAVCMGDGVEDEDLLDLLMSLTDKSLVVCEDDGVTIRYRLLETVRQYASERLQARGSESEVRTRHRDCYLSLAEETEPRLRGPDQARWLSCLAAEYDNLRAALAWCEAASPQDDSVWLRLAASLERFWYMGGYFSEGRYRLGRVLERTQALPESALRARTLRAAGVLAWDQGDYDDAQALLQDGLDLFRKLSDRQGVAQVLNSLGNVSWGRGDYETAERLYHESLDMQRQIGNRREIAVSLGNLGLLAAAQGNYSLARTWYDESLEIRRRMGDWQGVAAVLNNLGSVALGQGDHPAARRLYEEGLALQRQIGDQPGIAVSLACLGDVALNEGDHLAARGLYQESLAIKRQFGDTQGIAIVLDLLGDIALTHGDHASAQACYRESLDIGRRIGDRRAVAFTLSSLGHAAFVQGNDPSARDLYAESLSIALQINNPKLIVSALEGFASVVVAKGDAACAARLWGAAAAVRVRIETPVPPLEREFYDAQQALARQALGDEAFAAALAAGGELTVEQAAHEALGTG